MTKLPLPLSAVISTVVSLLLLFSSADADALSAGDTIAATSSAICGLATDPSQTITCHVTALPNQQPLHLFSNVTFTAVSGGDSFLCGLRSGGDSVICWDNLSSPNSTLAVKPHRLYPSTNSSPKLRSISVGESHVCAIRADTSAVTCWPRYGRAFSFPAASEEFESISSGSGFTCGILKSTSLVKCWGYNPIRTTIESGFGNATVLSLVSGASHACGITTEGLILCKGTNESGQLNAPIGTPFEFNQLSLGGDHGCAIRSENGSVVCWGGAGEFSSGNVSFELVVSGKNFSCGLTTLNFSVVCWGPRFSLSAVELVPIPLPEILPGQCISATSCGNCTTFPNSLSLCSGEGMRICKPCFNRGNSNLPSPPPQNLVPVPVPVPAPAAEKKGLRRGLLAFAIVGSVGGLAGIITAMYCLYTGVCFGKKKIHSSVQPTITRAPSSNTTSGSPPPSLIRRNGSRIMRRQRSGTSSKHADRAEEFTLAELASATADFSPENRIGSGSFGVVYRGKLPDGRQVAIKRGDPQKKQQRHREKESAFESELSFLSRLHHKHLVRLIGFCDEDEERLLVYEYMKNGALFDHLHGNNDDVALNDWKMRIKVALDAARGIEYLHTYAVPPIIHRDIKSSNILLDATWTAKVSDFGLSMMGPGSGSDQESSAIRPAAKAAGTVGYIDPEYYGLNVLTAKSDVYGLGVVLLELLTGKRAIFKDGEGIATSVVDYAVPAIMAGEIGKVLDSRPGPPELNEGEAVELVAYTAMHCVNLEGRERPTMTDIVANLERALGLCDHSHGSISSGILSIRSE